ncbi:MAG: PAS domain-containing sensor histidine kinase [Proteobacteria bacterium]|nr:PAS domain-containing sensor histidine kinase [Pseudomonadota bacterium]
MRFLFRRIRESEKFLTSLGKPQNFFQTLDGQIPEIRTQSAFRGLMWVTILAPVIMGLGVLLFLELYPRSYFLTVALIVAATLFAVGMSWVTRFLLSTLADTIERSQNHLKQSEEHFRLLANSIPELVSVADGDGQALWYNDAWYRYTGSSPQEKAGINWRHVHHPDYFPLVLSKWKNGLETKAEFEVQFPLKGKDGMYRRFHYRATPVKDGSGKVLLWCGTSTDIEAEMVQVEDQQFLKEATTTLNSSLDFDSILSMSETHPVPLFADWGTTINIAESDSKAKEELLGLLEEVNWDQIREGKVEVLVIKALTNLFLRDNGFSEAAIFPILLRGGAYGAYVYCLKKEQAFDSRKIRMLTEFTQLCTNALNNAKLHEDVKNAVQTRDDFISVASHELKTPLTSLQLQVQMLERQLQEGQNVKPENIKSAEFCREQIQKLSHLIGQLFDITQIRIGKVQLERTESDLLFHIGEVCKRFHSQAKAQGVEIEWSPKDPIVGNWDALRLEQIISNLISNALKYGNGKPILIKAEFLEKERKARFSVCDRGLGIPKTQQRKIFERFSSGSPNSRGLGLGLYICRQLTQAHGGKIEVKSQEGEGSEFTVTLPL